jgi:hypothetical protein
MRKRGQIWVETALYTLIGLVLIGLVLGFVNPKINESRDRLLVQQTIDSLNKIDEGINIGSGNVRVGFISVKQGSLFIHPESDTIVFELDQLSKPYSEIGRVVEIGRVKAFSDQGQKYASVNLTLDYSGIFDLKYKGLDETFKLSSAPAPYKLTISNEDVGDLDLDVIDISVSIGGKSS